MLHKMSWRVQHAQKETMRLGFDDLVVLYHSRWWTNVPPDALAIRPDPRIIVLHDECVVVSAPDFSLIVSFDKISWNMLWATYISPTKTIVGRSEYTDDLSSSNLNARSCSLRIMMRWPNTSTELIGPAIQSAKCWYVVRTANLAEHFAKEKKPSLTVNILMLRPVRRLKAFG